MVSPWERLVVFVGVVEAIIRLILIQVGVDFVQRAEQQLPARIALDAAGLREVGAGLQNLKLVGTHGGAIGWGWGGAGGDQDARPLGCEVVAWAGVAPLAGVAGGRQGGGGDGALGLAEVADDRDGAIGKGRFTTDKGMIAGGSMKRLHWRKGWAAGWRTDGPVTKGEPTDKGTGWLSTYLQYTRTWATLIEPGTTCLGGQRWAVIVLAGGHVYCE